MSLLTNKDAKKLLVVLTLLLLLGIVLAQMAAYRNTLQFKNEMMLHDYRLAGYLSSKYPQLAAEIPSAFTSDKSEKNLKAGKVLLEQAGYRESTQMHLIPQVNELYRTNMLINLFFSILISLAILLTAYCFLRAHYKKIDVYNDDINKIMKGEISTRLDDNEEGSLPKLAASINVLVASLHTHIEKEKQNRVFLKDILENVSHQLKTPLSALYMYTEIMKYESVDNEVIVNFLNKNENELDRMQGLITKLLKLAKLDAGIIELSKSNCLLSDIARQAVQSFEARLLKEQKTFEIKDEGEVLYVCDREWMLEALSNLIKNAVEHTAAGNHIEVLIEETPLMAKITVKDNGEGVHPEDISHIFKRFYRSKLSQNKQGTGIGLTLAKSIIEMHGGFIAVESTIKKGAVFTIHLPKLTEL